MTENIQHYNLTFHLYDSLGEKPVQHERIEIRRRRDVPANGTDEACTLTTHVVTKRTDANGYQIVSLPSTEMVDNELLVIPYLLKIGTKPEIAFTITQDIDYNDLLTDLIEGGTFAVPLSTRNKLERDLSNPLAATLQRDYFRNYIKAIASAEVEVWAKTINSTTQFPVSKIPDLSGSKISNKSITLNKIAQGTPNRLVGFDLQGNAKEFFIPNIEELEAITSSTKFISLIDTPTSFTGGAGKFVKVNAEENATEFGGILANDIPSLNASKINAGTFGTARIADDAITLAKMAPGAIGKYIGYDTSGNPAELDAPEGTTYSSATRLDAAFIHDGTVSNAEFKHLDGVTSAIQTQLNRKQASITASARLNANLIHDGSVSNAEFGYLDGVTSAIQTQLNTKQAIVSGVSSTEIGHLNGVTSAIQTQLNRKQASITASARLNANLIHDGTVSNAAFGHLANVSSDIQAQIDGVSGGGTTYSTSARLDAAFIHDGSVSNAEFKYLANVSSDIQAQLSTLQTNIDNVSGGGTTYSASDRLNAAFIHDGSVSNAEFKHLDGVTSAIQTQLNAKQASITTSARLNANLIHDGSVSNAEFKYLANVSSDIQAQLDAKVVPNLDTLQRLYVSWDGADGDPTTAASEPQATRKGTTTGSPYNAAQNRWEITNASSRNYNLNWSSDEVAWDRFSMAFDLEQTQRNWATTLYWGSTTDTVASDASIRNATGGYGLWIGRPTITGGEGFDTSGWNIFLTVAGNPSSRQSNPDIEIFNDAVISTTNSNKNIVSISNEMLDRTGNRHDFLLVHFRSRVKLYIDGIHFVTWTLNASEQTKGTGTNFGIAGDTGSASAKRVYLYGLFIASSEVADVIPRFNPRVAATEEIHGSVRAAASGDASNTTSTEPLAWSPARLQTKLNTKQNTISASARLNAAFIHDGTVSNAEFKHLNGVTSAIQTQLNAKQASITTSARLDAALIHDGTVSNAEFKYLANVTSDIQAQIDNIQSGGISAIDSVARTAAATANTTANQNRLLLGSVGTLDLDANTISGIDAVKIGSGNVSNAEFGRLDGVTSAIQTQLNAKQASITTSARLDAALIHDGTVSNAEFKYLANVTSDIQAQITAAASSGGTTYSASARLNAAFIHDGSVSNAEFGYLDGVTSAIQTQLNRKQVIVSGVSSTEIGHLNGVTSAIQTQLNAKQASITASARLDATLIHDGTVSNAEFKYLANVSSDIQAQLATLQTNINNVSGGTTYSASARLNAAFIHDGSVSNAEFKFLDGVTSTIQTQLNAKQPTISGSARISASHIHNGSVSDSEFGHLNGVTSAIQTQLNAKHPTIDSNHRLNAFFVGSGGVTNGIWDHFANVSSDIQAQLDGKEATIGQANRISALNIHDGTVSNAEFGFINGLTSNAQAQINKRQTIVTNVGTTEIAYLANVTSDIQAQIDTIQSGGISAIDTTARAAAATANATANQNRRIFTSLGTLDLNANTISGIDAAFIYNGNVSNAEFGHLDGVTSAIQVQLDAKQASITTTARLNATLIHDGSVSNAEFKHLDGVTSAIQTQINAKQAIVTGVSTAEIGYLANVSSDIQAQLNVKQAIVTGVSTAEISYLANVTSDIQAQIDAGGGGGTTYDASNRLDAAFIHDGSVSNTEFATLSDIDITQTIESRLGSLETGGTGSSVTENFNTEEIGSGDFILTGTTFPTEEDSAVIVIPEGDDAPDWLLLNTGQINTGTYFAANWHWVHRETLLGRTAAQYGLTRATTNSIRITDTVDATDGDVYIGWINDTVNSRKLLTVTSDNAAHDFYGLSLRKPVSVISGLVDGVSSGGTTYSASARLNAAFIHDGSVSNAEFKHLDGVTSAIQTQLNAKQASITTLARLDAALIHDGTVSNAAFGYLANVTSDIQAQISHLTGGSSSGVQFVSAFPETPSNEDVAVFYENNVQTPATDAISLGQRLSSGDIDLSSLSQIASITGFKIGTDNKAYLVNTTSEEVIIVDRDSNNGFSSTSPVTTFTISPSANFSRGLTIDSDYAYVLSDRYMHAFSLTSNPIGAVTTSRRYQFAGSIGARGGVDVRNNVFWSARSVRTECDIEKFSWNGSSYTSEATYTIPNIDANGLAFDGNYVFVLLKNGPTHSITVRNPSDFTEVTTIALPSGIANPTGLTVHNGILYVYEGTDNIAYAFAAAAQDAAEEVAQLAGDVYRYTDTAMDWNKLGSIGGAGELTVADIPALNASKINAGVFGVSRIPSLAASKITSGALDTARIPTLNASKINAGVFGVSRIPSLAASKITSGALDTARIPTLNASKINAGVFGVSRIPSLAASKITSGTLSTARLAASGSDGQVLTHTGSGMAWEDAASGGGGTTIIKLTRVAYNALTTYQSGAYYAIVG